MTYAGSLAMTTSIRHLSHSSKSGKVAAIPMPGFNGPPDVDTSVHFYDEQFLQFEKLVTLPLFDAGGNSYPTHGQFIFISSDGASTFAVIKVDPAAGALQDFGIATL